MKRTTLVLVAAAQALFGCAGNDDVELGKALIGSWIAPPDSAIYLGVPGREEFRSDGTYTTYIYRTADCKTVLLQLDGKWAVQDGVLITTRVRSNTPALEQLRIVSRDRIEKTARNRLTFRSLDDGTAYYLQRADGCFPAAPVIRGINVSLAGSAPPFAFPVRDSKDIEEDSEPPIVYALKWGMFHGISVLDPHTLTSTNLTLPGCADSHPSWSPDHQWIAFAGDCRENGKAFLSSAQIYVMRKDGTQRQQLTATRAGNFFPRWSPDGSRIVFQSNRNGKSQIYVMNRDGSDQHNISGASPADDADPDWSPTGDEIVFSSNRIGRYHLYVMRPDGSQVKRLSFGSANDAAGRWAPDGQSILFVSTAGGIRQLYLMDRQGAKVMRLTDSIEDMISGDWSRDGRYIVYAVKKDAHRPVIGLIDLERRTTKVLVDQFATVPDW